MRVIECSYIMLFPTPSCRYTLAKLDRGMEGVFGHISAVTIKAEFRGRSTIAADICHFMLRIWQESWQQIDGSGLA